MEEKGREQREHKLDEISVTMNSASYGQFCRGRRESENIS
jgi:hypothetical protein